MKTNWKFFFSNAVSKQLGGNTHALFSLWVLAFFFLLALLAPVIANQQPLFVKLDGRAYFPELSFSDKITIQNEKTGVSETFLKKQIDWRKIKADHIVWPPIPFSPGHSDQEHPDYAKPFTRNHWLGTDRNGSDVLAGLIYGTRISLSVGIISMAIASFIGLWLGLLAGYFGDYRLQVSQPCFWMMLMGILPGYFYGFYVRAAMFDPLLKDPGAMLIVQLVISLVIFLFFVFVFHLAGKLLSRIKLFSAKVFVPLDSFISRSIEIFISIPRLVLIITIAAITRPSLVNLVLIIGFTSWTEIARLTRAEVLRIRNSSYIESARVMGFSISRILFRHVLPNALAPASIAIVFGIASAILIESGLSFLGIGVPQNEVTWGSLLLSGKENFSAWWLVVFPGFAIFITVTALNLLGDALREAMTERSSESNKL